MPTTSADTFPPSGASSAGAADKPMPDASSHEHAGKANRKKYEYMNLVL
jgi:hypothetical protein